MKFHRVFDHICVLYTIWVLAGVLAFVTHLGDDLREIAATGDEGGLVPFLALLLVRFLPGTGGAPSFGSAADEVVVDAVGDNLVGLPGRAGAIPSETSEETSEASFVARIVAFLAHNIPAAMLFVLHHSAWRNRARLSFPTWIRLFLRGTQHCQCCVARRNNHILLRGPWRGYIGLFHRWLHSRVGYNFISAALLHHFMAQYVGIRRSQFGTKMWSLTIPFVSSTSHAVFALVVLVPCFVVFLRAPETRAFLYGLDHDNFRKMGSISSTNSLVHDQERNVSSPTNEKHVAFVVSESDCRVCKGTMNRSTILVDGVRRSDGDGCSDVSTATNQRRKGSNDTTAPIVPVSIDVISLMGLVVHRKFGSFGFLAYSGLAIVPREIRLDDVIVRFVAALYLRARSRHFRALSERIGHGLGWAVRSVIVVLSVAYGSYHYRRDVDGHMTKNVLEVFLSWPVVVGTMCAVGLGLWERFVLSSSRRCVQQ